MKKSRLIFGVGEFARMLYNYCKESNIPVAGFTVDANYITTSEYCGQTIYDFATVEKYWNPKETDMILGITFTNKLELRKRIYMEAKDKGYELPPFIHYRAYVSPWASIGESCIILEHNTIQDGCILEENSVLWSGNHIGHKTIIGPHNFISSHVVLAMGVRTEERVFIGINAAVAPYMRIGQGSVLGMGVIVAKYIPPNSVVKRQVDEVE